MTLMKLRLGWILFSPFLLFIAEAHADTFKSYLNAAKITRANILEKKQKIIF